MKYLVESNQSDIIGSFRSVKKACKAIEEYYQCGIDTSSKEALRAFKYSQRNEVLVFHCLDNAYNCTISKIN